MQLSKKCSLKIKLGAETTQLHCSCRSVKWDIYLFNLQIEFELEPTNYFWGRLELCVRSFVFLTMEFYASLLAWKHDWPQWVLLQGAALDRSEHFLGWAHESKRMTGYVKHGHCCSSASAGVQSCRNQKFKAQSRLLFVFFSKNAFFLCCHWAVKIYKEGEEKNILPCPVHSGMV